MKKISQDIIRQWYTEDYAHEPGGSVYGQAPKKVKEFHDLLKRSGTVKTVLDLGCGDGRSLIELATMGFQVTGIDLSGKGMVQERAKKEGVNVRFIEADITTYPFEQETYDAVIASEVLHLLSRETGEGVIDRIIQTVAPGGYVYISILSNLTRAFIATGEEFEYENQPSYTEEESRQLLAEKFSRWNTIELDAFHMEQDWPLKPGNYPIEPYHWSGEFVFIIAQKGFGH